MVSNVNHGVVRHIAFGTKFLKPGIEYTTTVYIGKNLTQAQKHIYVGVVIKSVGIPEVAEDVTVYPTVPENFEQLAGSPTFDVAFKKLGTENTKGQLFLSMSAGPEDYFWQNAFQG